MEGPGTNPFWIWMDYCIPFWLDHGIYYFYCCVTNYHRCSGLNKTNFVCFRGSEVTGSSASLTSFQSRCQLAYIPFWSSKSSTKLTWLWSEFNSLQLDRCPAFMLALSPSETPPLLTMWFFPGPLRNTALYLFSQRISLFRKSLCFFKTFTWLSYAHPRSSPFWLIQHQLIWDLNYTFKIPHLCHIT